jgi:hypothetical protein
MFGASVIELQLWCQTIKARQISKTMKNANQTNQTIKKSKRAAKIEHNTLNEQGCERIKESVFAVRSTKTDPRQIQRYIVEDYQEFTASYGPRAAKWAIRFTCPQLSC